MMRRDDPSTQSRTTNPTIRGEDPSGSADGGVPMVADEASPLRVLVLLNVFEIGGTQLNAIDLASQLRHHGVDSQLFAYSVGASTEALLQEYAKSRGETIASLPRQNKGLVSTRQISDLARSHSADLIHVFGYSDLIHYSFWGGCALGRRPMVMTIYEMYIPSGIPRHQRMIVGTRQLAEDQAGRPGGVELISPPVDIERDDRLLVDCEPFLAEHGLSDTALRVGIISRLDTIMKARAVADAITAVGELSAQTPVQLVVVGSGDAEAHLRALAHSVNRTRGWDCVKFTGALSDPRPAYASSDVVVGMGGSAARALSFGRPLVVSGENGWYRTFEPTSATRLFRDSFWSLERMADPVGSLRACLSPLLADPSKRRDLGMFGRQFAADNFALSEMAKKTAHIYRAARQDKARFSRWMRDVPQERGPVFRGLRSVPLTLRRY